MTSKEDANDSEEANDALDELQQQLFKEFDALDGMVKDYVLQRIQKGGEPGFEELLLLSQMYAFKQSKVDAALLRLQISKYAGFIVKSITTGACDWKNSEN